MLLSFNTHNHQTNGRDIDNSPHADLVRSVGLGCKAYAGSAVWLRHMLLIGLFPSGRKTVWGNCSFLEKKTGKCCFRIPETNGLANGT
jgi:hypothetical protein